MVSFTKDKALNLLCLKIRKGGGGVGGGCLTMSNLSHKARTLTGLTIGPIVMSLLIEEILQAETKAWKQIICVKTGMFTKSMDYWINHNE